MSTKIRQRSQPRTRKFISITQANSSFEIQNQLQVLTILDQAKQQNAWTSKSQGRNGSNDTEAKSLEVVMTSIVNNLAMDENQAKFDNMQQESDSQLTTENN